MVSHGLKGGSRAKQQLSGSLKGGLRISSCLIAESYNSALNWKNDSELSHWLTDNLST